MSTFAIEAEYITGEKSYISHISPIVWTDNIKEAKKYTLKSDAEYDLTEEFHTIQTIFFSTKIVSISIIEMKNDEIIERYQVI